MKKYGINIYNKKDSILNTPGQFFFQIKEDGEYKTNNVHISRKIFDEIKIKIISTFKTISQNLKLMVNRFSAGSENDKIRYYTDIFNKLDKFVDLSYNRGFNFPGLQVISLTSKQTDIFAQLKKRVLICEKSDGVRYLLIHFANGKSVMLGRSLEFFLVEFTSKLPVNIKNAGPHSANVSHINNEWEIVSILDGELILDEVEYVKNLKQDIRKKNEEGTLEKILPKRSESDKTFFGDIDEENNNEDDQFFNPNNIIIHSNNNNSVDINFYDNKKAFEEKVIKYLKNLSVQQKSTMVYINDDLFQVKFVVFDAIILDNLNIGHLPFHMRLENLAQYFKNLNWPNIHEDLKSNFLNNYLNKIEPALDGFKENLLKYSNKSCKDKYFNTSSLDLNLKFKIDLLFKDYFTFDKIQFLYEKICNKLPHENDGIILNLDDYPYYSGQATEIFKWKPQSLNTVDFEVEPKRFNRRNGYNKNSSEKDSFEEMFLLKVAESREREKVINILLFENKEEEKNFINELIVTKSSNSKAVIECNFEKNEKLLRENFHKYEVLKRNDFEYIQDMLDPNSHYGQSYRIGYWKFLRFRKDKLHGNSLQTFYKVWESIEDNLTIEKMQKKIDY